jgi:hypothetical protein
MLWNDILYAFRMMRRTPQFTAAVVLTVTLAIAAHITIFSVINAVILQCSDIAAAPVRDPNRSARAIPRSRGENIVEPFLYLRCRMRA